MGVPASCVLPVGEDVGLVRRNRSTHVVEHAVREIDGFLHGGAVVYPGGDDHEVISQDAWEGAYTTHGDDPWPHLEGYEHHGEGASLWYATSSRVGLANALADGVPHDHVLHVPGVGVQDLDRHARLLGDHV